MRINEKKSKFILLLFTVTLFLGILTRNISSLDSFSTEKDQIIINNIKYPSASNNYMINITTPENKTYTKPMNGYYPATYGFENDANGTIPHKWEKVTSGTSSIQVSSEFNGHKHVLKGYSPGTGGAWNLKNYFNNTEGTIEFWVAHSSDFSYSEALTILIYGDSEFLIEIELRNGEIGTWPGSSIFQLLDIYEINIWYHIRLDFRSSSGNPYEGLNQNEYKIYINGEDKGTYSFQNSGNPSNIVLIGSGSSGVEYFGYFDAFGYSWDSSYDIGDNRNEGLLLSFNSGTTLDWIGHSLDGQTNKTILGNTTIPIPEKGAHHIQISGNNTVGVLYQSDIRYFSVQDITIITPENKTYIEPMSGYYPATYGFESDDNGSDPEEWSLSENPPNYEIEVVSEKNGHKKVVHIYDNENEWRSMNHYPDKDPTTGTIELWVLGADVTDSYFVVFMRDTTIRKGFQVNILEDKWQYYDSVGYHDVSNVGLPQDNTWHHLRIDFRCAGAPAYEGLSMASYRIIVDGIVSGEMPFFDSNANHLERLAISTDAAPNSEWWVDAIGFSWDPNYNVGDNLDEGLLLSLEKIITLKWMGYSLDGLPNKTILGNITFPFPENGAHNIQVFGNNSLGSMHHSDLRMFFVSRNNANKPSLSNGIVTPISGNQGTLFNFSVIYTDIDNNTPSYVNVIINGTLYEMAKVHDSDNIYNNGVLYYYLTYLSASTYNYSYYFDCSDGVFINSTRIFDNLEVKSTNNYKPRLIYPQVMPGYGGDFTLFNFTVLYVDEDNNLPVQVNITINSLIYTMQPVDIFDNIALDGIQFFFNTTLDFNLYQFQINCSDGLFTNSTDWINGPEVSPFFNIDPITLLSPSYNANIASGWVNFSWSSVDAPFGTVNYTIQISNNTAFSHIIYEFRSIIETTGVSSLSIFIDFQPNPYYWRIRPTYGIFNGSWSNYFLFYTFSNINAPLLTSSTSLPNSGTEHTIFEFTVTYFDFDNNAPTYVKILINNIAFYMEKQNPSDNNYVDGCVYQYSTLLEPSPNPYYYSFECSDGTYLNSTSIFIGPSVHIENPPDRGEAGQNNLNSENIFNSILIIGIGLGIIIPFIAFTEFKIKKLKRTPEVLSKNKHKF
ncbi:MAG: hypothetical protein ACFE8M_12050 [Candidatus Hermodarchaeota archaeon]